MKKFISLGLGLVFIFLLIGESFAAVQRFVPRRSVAAKVVKIDREEICGTWRDRYRKNAQVHCEKERETKRKRTREYKSDYLQRIKPKKVYMPRRVQRRVGAYKTRSNQNRRVNTPKKYYLHYGFVERPKKEKKDDSFKTSAPKRKYRMSTTKRFYSHYGFIKHRER